MFTTQDRKFLSMLHIADDGSDVQTADAPAADALKYAQYVGRAERPVPLLDPEAMAVEVLNHCTEIGHAAIAIVHPVAILVELSAWRVIPIEQAYLEMFGEER